MWACRRIVAQHCTGLPPLSGLPDRLVERGTLRASFSDAFRGALDQGFPNPEA